MAEEGQARESAGLLPLRPTETHGGKVGQRGMRFNSVTLTLLPELCSYGMAKVEYKNGGLCMVVDWLNKSASSQPHRLITCPCASEVGDYMSFNLMTVSHADLFVLGIELGALCVLGKLRPILQLCS